jgi:hypothetical protein
MTSIANPAAPSSREMAELFLGAMSIMAAADGQISITETTIIRSLAAAVPELEDADLTVLIPNAATAIRQGAQFPEWVRKRAFVLGVEVVTRGNEGDYKDGDANSRGVTMLQRGLALPEDFTNAVLTTVKAKYQGGDPETGVLETMVDAMLFVATATRTSIGRLRRVASILEMVPQLAGREITSLFYVPNIIAGKPLPMLEPAGPDDLATRLRKIPQFRDKTFVLATEVATALGMDLATERAFDVVEQSLATTKGLPSSAKTTWSAKYARSA